MHAARREGLLQGAWEQWQQSRGGEGGRPSEMETDKDGEVGKGDAQQTDKLQEDKLRKLQAVKEIRRILTGNNLLEGEGSSQGSESEGGQEEGAQMMEGKAGRQVKVSYLKEKKGKRNSGKEGVLRRDGAFVEVCDFSGRVVDKKRFTEREVEGMDYMEAGDSMEMGSVQATLRESWWMEESGSDE